MLLGSCVTTGAPNVPSPPFRRTEITPEFPLAVAMSGNPSPLKSATATSRGLGAGYVAAVMKVVGLHVAALATRTSDTRTAASRRRRFKEHLLGQSLGETSELLIRRTA